MAGKIRELLSIHMLILTTNLRQTNPVRALIITDNAYAKNINIFTLGI